jgi:hypothetical protein
MAFFVGQSGNVQGKSQTKAQSEHFTHVAGLLFLKKRIKEESMISDTHFGQALAALLSQFTISVEADQLYRYQCEDRVEDIWIAFLKYRRELEKYYATKIQYNTLFARRQQGEYVSSGTLAHYEVSIGALESSKHRLLAQADQIYKEFPLDAKVFWLKGIRWTYQGRTLDALLESTDIISLSQLRTFPIVAISKNAFVDPEITYQLFRRDFTDPAAEKVAPEECYLYEHERHRTDDLKRFFGEDQYQLLVDARILDIWGKSI